MKIEITSVNVCIPLTERQWKILMRREDANDNRTRHLDKIVMLCDTWKFPNCDKISKWEWNGHFGRNIFFTAEAGAEKDALKFLEKLLK